MQIELFEEYLIKNLPKVNSFHPHYEKALQTMLLGGGKRFRPKLLLSVVEFYEPLLLKNSFDVALSLEYLHTYSLIHDDLPAMDNATLRRNTPTLHTTYNEALAILIGDALNTESFYKISNSSLDNDIKISLINALSKDGGMSGMVLGQAIDLHFENKKLTPEELLILHKNKTAKLIATSLKMGAIIVNLPIKKQNELYNIGIELGVLFQIQDDILDTTSSKEQEGKNVQQDESKNSFITIFGLEESKKQADEKVQLIEKSLLHFDDKFYHHIKKVLNPYINRHKKKIS